MKKIYKRVLALLLVCVIVSSTTYKAHAAATVPVVVSAGEAIAYVLGILGITAGAGYVIDKKEEITSWGSDQIVKLKDWTKTNSDKVNAWGAATSQEIETSIDAWFEKLRTGTLDTASAVWDSIKAWGGSIMINCIRLTYRLRLVVQLLGLHIYCTIRAILFTGLLLILFLRLMYRMLPIQHIISVLLFSQRLRLLFIDVLVIQLMLII